MKRKLLTFFLLCTQLCIQAQGWPENYGGVMLQGFYWDSYEDAKWSNLTAQADELSSYFSLIWVPNSGQTKEDQWNSPGNWGFENMGYMPVYWLKHNTCFGTQEELVNMINTFKAKGTGFIEDVVINHKNGLTNWADFPNETATGPKTGKTYTITWSTDMQNLWGICANDELFTSGNGVHDGVTYACSSASNDEGDNFDGCRDLDHTNSMVQQNIYEYLDFLLDELGYVGFRYDMVKGYKAYYTGLYNVHAQPQFSVGEYWDDNYDNVAGYWIKETGLPANGTIQSAAFDFPLKYKINQAFNNGAWSVLSNKGVAGDPAMSRYAVTFVDNHDTYRNTGDRVNSNVLAANAFILTMPGTPCIFLPHWKEYKPELKKMIAARKAAGITNQSEITAQYEVENGYYLKVTGTKGSIILTLGNLLNQTVDTQGHTLVQSGDNFALYLWDGVYDQNTFDAIDEESAKDITIYVKDNNEGAPYLYVWNGGNNLNGAWPGAQLSEKATLADGTSWYKQTFHASSVNAIVTFNDGNQSSDITNITEDKYICYYKGNSLKYADYTPLYKGDASSDYVNAFFDAPAGWYNAWAWCTLFYDVENKNYTGGSWPGQTMTKVGISSTGNDIYQWKTTKNYGEGVPDYILFNNGSGSQTGNLEFVNSAYYDQNGLASEDMLSFYPTVLQNATMTTGVNWDGSTQSLAQGDASTTMKHAMFYPAGTYTIQAIVRGSEGCTAEMNLDGTTTTAELTGMADGAESTVTTDGVVEYVAAGTNNGWQKLQGTISIDDDGMLTISLSSDAAVWQVGALTILKDADSQDKYRTIATTSPTQTNADVTSMSRFSFYERGANKNALVTAAAGQSPALLPCNAVVNGNCSNLMLTDGAFDFFAPADFMASEIHYDRIYDKEKKVTVCLPFAMSSEELDNLGIKAYEFDAVSTNGNIHFSSVPAMEANTPYVISADGAAFASLTSREVKKTGNCTKTIGDVSFVGTMSRTILNSSGTTNYYGYSNGQFVKVGKNVGVNPFRAYIASTTNLGASANAIFDDSHDGINEISTSSNGANAVYGIDGRYMGTKDDAGKLGKGLYIINGKKHVIR